MRTSRDRSSNTRNIKERFLIICEGEKTEPNYFRCFHAQGRVVKVEGTGYNTISLVREAIRLKDEKELEARRKGFDGFDQSWCVFDRDSFPPDDFNNAIAFAEKHGFRVAYSNEAFELWYLLHFDYHDAATSRISYGSSLTTRLGHEYTKNSETIYEELLTRQEIAITNAKRLLVSHKTNNPQRNNPSTTVHLLVEELNKSVFI